MFAHPKTLPEFYKIGRNRKKKKKKTHLGLQRLCPERSAFVKKNLKHQKTKPKKGRGRHQISYFATPCDNMLCCLSERVSNQTRVLRKNEMVHIGGVRGGVV